MSSRTRPAALARLEEDLRQHEFILHSQRTLNELDTFIFHNLNENPLNEINKKRRASPPFFIYTVTSCSLASVSVSRVSPSVLATINVQTASPVMLTAVLIISSILSIPIIRAIPSTGSPT